MAFSNTLQSSSPTLAAASSSGPLAEREGQRVYWVFVLCLLLVSLPVKNLSYVVPPLYLAIEFFARDRITLRTALLMVACFAVSGLSILIDHLAGNDVNPAGLFLLLLTSLPLFIFMAYKVGKKIDQSTLTSLVSLVAWFVILQSVVGCLQFVASRNADAVAGTFGLFDFYLNTISIIQVYYTFNLFCMILFMLLQPHRLLVRVSIVFGLVACVLAQSGAPNHLLFGLLRDLWGGASAEDWCSTWGSCDHRLCSTRCYASVSQNLGTNRRLVRQGSQQSSISEANGCCRRLANTFVA